MDRAAAILYHRVQVPEIRIGKQVLRFQFAVREPGEH